MATLIPKPKSLLSHHLSRDKLLFLILFVVLLFTGALIGGAVCFHKQFKQLHRLRQDLSQTQFTISQHKSQFNQLSYEGNLRISNLQQDWTYIERKLRSQEELIRKLDHLLPQNSPHPDRREASLLEELKAHKKMYIQAQQKNQLYEQQLLALTQEMKYFKEQNQLIRQEQIKIRAEHQELLNQRAQVSEEQQPLSKSLSQLVNADYEFVQKLQDVQKAVGSCAKIGELKALEVYYDDRLDNLSRALQKPHNTTSKDLLDYNQFKQLKQDFLKLAEEEETIKATFNKFVEHERKNEERLKALENHDNLNVMSARPVAAPVQPLEELLKEAVKNYNLLSESGQNKKELKEMKKKIRHLHQQINQQSQKIYQKDTAKQSQSQGTQTEQILESEFLDQSSFERQLGNDIANVINAFVDLYHDL